MNQCNKFTKNAKTKTTKTFFLNKKRLGQTWPSPFNNSKKEIKTNFQEFSIRSDFFLFFFVVVVKSPLFLVCECNRQNRNPITNTG